MLHPTHFEGCPSNHQYLEDGIYKCPCCKFSTDSEFKFTGHIQNHIKHAVHHGEVFICKCNGQCRSTAHFHCLFCTQTLIRKDQVALHLDQCSNKPPLSSPPSSPHDVPPSVPDTSLPPPSPPASTLHHVPSSAPPARENQTVLCPQCGVFLKKRNLKLHIQRKHNPEVTDITARKHLKSQPIDHKKGIFAVVKSFTCPSTPIHVVKRTCGKDLVTKCELDICRINADFSEYLMCPSECHHIQSLVYCPPSRTENPSLTEVALQEMVSEKWFDEDKKERCLKRQREAMDAGTPLSCKVTICSPSTKKYISIYEPTASYYSGLGRVMVTYDSKLISWHCPCARSRQSCLHKNIAKWHLFEVERELFQKTNVEKEETLNLFPTEVESMEEEEDGLYPPEGNTLERMFQYIYSCKKIPPVPERSVVITDNFPRSYTPVETFCTECPEATPLDEPELITSMGKVLTVTDVIEGISVYRKQCYTCGMVYRYQEWSDGVYNFDDHILLSLHLCLFLRNSLQTHQAVGRAIEVLERTSGKTYPSKNKILQAYLAFEALSDHDSQIHVFRAAITQ